MVENITDADVAELMKDERSLMRLSNIILQRLLKEANTRITELEAVSKDKTGSDVNG
ncbi:hypothetical protein LCGC14_1403710 [marine sediment metagenome]|uniref:Uncharacterized protein n=1 Tax=marine sediment metagenome TaxID=412755 RepID=A0A0F9MBR1_9ZZZZ